MACTITLYFSSKGDFVRFQYPKVVTDQIGRVDTWGVNNRNGKRNHARDSKFSQDMELNATPKHHTEFTVPMVRPRTERPDASRVELNALSLAHVCTELHRAGLHWLRLSSL